MKKVLFSILIAWCVALTACAQAVDVYENGVKVKTYINDAETNVKVVLRPLTTLKVATYNVDGLPDKLLGISINSDGPVESGSSIIGQRLEDSGWDIIGLNEDFNYHDYITGSMSSYNFQTYSGNIYSSATAIAGIALGTWRFDCDGLELATKKGLNVKNETIIPWNDAAVYGYLSNDYDGLTKKGFRYYTVTTTDNHDIDVIILHADAGSADEDIQAREAGMSQLYDFITTQITTSNPLIVMGDYNCRYSRDRLKELLIDRINELSGLMMQDAALVTGATEDLDKILYMNREACSYSIKVTEAHPITDFLREDGTTQLSDHKPMYATFIIE